MQRYLSPADARESDLSIYDDLALILDDAQVDGELLGMRCGDDGEGHPLLIDAQGRRFSLQIWEVL